MNEASGLAVGDGAARPLRIAHLSDIHFGKIGHAQVVDALVADVNADASDVVVVSGDLTQRARRHEYRAAAAMLRALRPPVLVVPGNHDVPAWWHDPVRRVFTPDVRFRTYITAERTPTFEAPGLAVFALDSAHGLTVKGGLIREPDLDVMASFFARQPAGTFRVFVLHHHLVRLDLGDHDVAIHGREALDRAVACGVDLVLCGHLHTSHVERVESAGGRALIIASAGTATSSRGRGADRERNQYNHVTVDADRFTVYERRFNPATVAFEPQRETVFVRAAASVPDAARAVLTPNTPSGARAAS